MSGSYRVFYPVEEVSIGPVAATSGTYIPLHGLQSCTTNTNFNIEYIFELGQIDIYDALENLPNVEMTLEKAFDGYPLIYHAASSDANGSSLNQRTIKPCDVTLSIFSDQQNSASGLPITQVYTSGMFINSVAYNMPVNGFFKETVTLVGNDRLWKTSSFAFTGAFNNNDAAASGVQRRSNFVMGAAPTGSVFPTNINGMTVSNGSGYNVLTSGQYGSHIQDISISCNLARENLLELGRLKPYYRFARFPAAVDCNISMIAAGSTPGDLINASSNGGDITAQPILLFTQDGTQFNLGVKNRLISTSYSGGDVGGSPVIVTYNFQNYNDLIVLDAADPAGFVS